VVWIARVLIAAQGRPGILSRGYRRRAEEQRRQAQDLDHASPPGEAVVDPPGGGG